MRHNLISLHAEPVGSVRAGRGIEMKLGDRLIDYHRCTVIINDDEVLRAEVDLPLDGLTIHDVLGEFFVEWHGKRYQLVEVT